MTEPQQGIFALISASVLPTTRLAARRLGVVTLLASSLIACGGDPEDPKTSDDDDSQTTVTTIVVSSAATGAGPAGAGGAGTTHATSGAGGDCNPGDGSGNDPENPTDPEDPEDPENPDDSDDPEGELLWPAKGLDITRITLNQGIRHTLMDGGEVIKDDTPVIADRPGVLRVFYRQFAQHNDFEVTARLTIGGAVYEKTVVHGISSSDDDLETTINFQVRRSHIAHGMSYKVELLHPAGGTWGEDVGRHAFPREAEQGINVTSTGDGLNIVLVPVVYAADGSNRMPDLSSAQLELHRRAIMAMYPVREVNLSVRSDSLRWTAPIGNRGEGWNALLTAVADLRTADNAENNSYYYGVFNPAESFGTFCAGGCVAGLGFVSPEMNSWSRASVGLGFSGEQLAEVFAHEIGHNHGRTHSPCGGPANPDPNFPDDNGSIGSWGINIFDGTLHKPSHARDFMSYCNPAWVSKYTYEALTKRAKLLNNVNMALHETEPRTYDRVLVGPDGEMTWAPSTTLRVPPQGESRDVDVATDGETRTETATLIPFDHIDGGVLFVPRPTTSRSATSRARAVRMDVAGQMRVIQR